jgi:hypothetical protein
MDMEMRVLNRPDAHMFLLALEAALKDGWALAELHIIEPTHVDDIPITHYRARLERAEDPDAP